MQAAWQVRLDLEGEDVGRLGFRDELAIAIVGLPLFLGGQRAPNLPLLLTDLELDLLALDLGDELMPKRLLDHPAGALDRFEQGVENAMASPIDLGEIARIVCIVEHPALRARLSPLILAFGEPFRHDGVGSVQPLGNDDVSDFRPGGCGMRFRLVGNLGRRWSGRRRRDGDSRAGPFGWIGQALFRDLLTCRLPRPVAARRAWDGQPLADLGQPLVADAEIGGEFDPRGRPDQVVKLLPLQRHGLLRFGVARHVPLGCESPRRAASSAKGGIALFRGEGNRRRVSCAAAPAPIK